MLILLLTGLLCLTQTPEVHAQQKNKSEYEKKNERKNRNNRRLKRRKDQAKSNREERRAARYKMRTRQGEKAYKGDIAGRRLIQRSSSKPRVTHAQPNPYAGRKPMTEARRAKYLRSSPRYSQRPRERAGRGQAYAGGSVRTTFTGKKAYKFRPWQSASRPSEQGSASARKRIVPRSASGAYVKNRRARPYAFRERSKWEDAYRGDITGRKFRGKRTTDRPKIQGPPAMRNRSSTRRGDKAYSGRAGGGYATATRKGERGYSGNVKQRRNLSATRPPEKAYAGRIFPRGNLSITKSAETTSRNRSRSGRRLSATRGGEVAGTRINRGRIGANGFGVASNFRGDMRARKPMKGGGSISGGSHNNNGRAVGKRGVTSQDIRVAGHQGKIRTTRGLKGGGSISAKLKRNNNDRPVRGFAPGRQDQQIVRFSGNLKQPRPEKNGARSIKRNNWNNNEQAIASRPASLQDINIAAFKGRSKGARKPPKGAGGSVSVLPWNNDEKPLEQKVPGKDTRVATSFQGKQKRSFKYVRNPSSHEDALKVKPVGKGTTLATTHGGSVRMRVKYEKNSNSAEGALRGIGPSRAMVQASQFQGNIKMSQKRYKNRHPSYKFENDSRTADNQRHGFSLKLWWSKLFKKQENQPAHLKEKERKPRFDKGEQGIWND